MSLRLLQQTLTPGYLFGLLPEELTTRGIDKSATFFRQTQRVSSWHPGEQRRPQLGREHRRIMAQHPEGLRLPSVESVHPSSDGSTRYLLQTHDGHRFECVHMPRDTKTPRVTLCLSSQVGCAMGCTFCATGKLGLLRHLSAGEIVGQVHAVLAHKGALHGDRLSLVFMGMGEPLHNLDAVHRAISVLCDARGLHIPPSRITVSTSGLVPGINDLAKRTPRPRLAISVNATTNEKRSAIMPIGKKHDLAALKKALLNFPQGVRDRIMLEYVLLAGENDSHDDAQRLAHFAEGLHAHVNVIPLNPHQDTTHQRPTDEAAYAFYKLLREKGVLAFIRNSRGQDIEGACGQLAQRQAP